MPKQKSPESEWMFHGWDDEKVYLYSQKTGDLCVSDEPELVARLIEVCLSYYRQKGKM